MSDFLLQRQNMVRGQLLPQGIQAESLLKELNLLSREKFLPDHLKPLAYADTHLFIENDHYLLRPLVFAQMVQALNVVQDDLVLCVGGHSAYEIALISRLCRMVVSLTLKEINENLLKEQQANNTFLFFGSLWEGAPQYAPYNKILVTCAVSKAPQALLNQLTEGGRLLCVIAEERVGHLTLFEKQSQEVKEKVLLETYLPHLNPSSLKGSFIL